MLANLLAMGKSYGLPLEVVTCFVDDRKSTTCWGWILPGKRLCTSCRRWGMERRRPLPILLKFRPWNWR